MRISSIKDIFVGIITTMAVAVGALNGCGQAASPAESAPDASSSEVTSLKAPEQYIGKARERSDDVNSSDDDTILIASWYEESYLTNLKDFLSAQFPEYNFEFLYLDQSNYGSLMDNQLACKSAPDVVCIDPSMAVKHAKAGNIIDLSELTTNFSTTGKEPFMYGGRTYAVPNTCDYECFFYNKTLFDKEFVKEPDEYLAYLEMCDFWRIKKHIKPLAAGLKDEILVANSAIMFPNAGCFTTLYGKTFGKRLQFGKASFHNELKEDLDYWEMLLEYKIFTPDMYLIDKKGAIEEFAAGEAAMLVGNPADYNQILKKNPDMEIGVFVIMDRKGIDSAMIGGSECGFAVNAYGKNKEAARAVVASLATMDGQEALWKDRKGSQTYLQNVKFRNPECFDDIIEVIDANRLVAPYYQWGPHSRELYHIFGKELQQVLLRKKNLDEALQDMDTQAQIIREEE